MVLLSVLSISVLQSSDRTVKSVLKRRESSGLSHILEETYAYLITEYLSSVGDPRPRFILLGFDDVHDPIRKQLSCRGISVVEPERSGRLKEASLLRVKSSEPCVILISKRNLGKFASLVTSFKVLEEVVIADMPSSRETTDVYRLLDVSRWLIHESLSSIIKYVEKKVGQLPVGIEYGGIQAVLDELWILANEKASFTEWLHPRRLIKGIVHAINKKHSGHAVSVASFLRSLGVESKEKLETFVLFDSLFCKEESLKELKTSLIEYSTILRKCVTADVPTQRRNLANICMNHLRNMLYNLANDELKKKGKDDWTGVFCDFEHAHSTKYRVVRKYKVEPRGVRICGRSIVSGLPICFRVPIELGIEEKTDRNLLQELSKRKMDKIVSKCSKLLSLRFSIKSLGLTQQAKSLLVEFSLLQKNGNIVLDPLLEGLKSPTPKINRLFATIEARREE